MDPESFAEYLGSQSLLDMMANANAHTVRDGDMGKDGGVDWDGSRDKERERGRDGGWNRSADRASTAYSLST